MSDKDGAVSMTDVVTVGIDIGCESTKVVLNTGSILEIVSNQGGHTTPTIVAFSNKNRFVGDDSYSASPHAVTHLNRLLIKDDIFEPFYRFDLKMSNDDAKVVSVEYNYKTQQFDATAILTMFLNKIGQNVQATLDRLLSTTSNYKLEYVLALPPEASQEIRNAVKDAAYAANMETVRIVDTTMCMAAAYQRKELNKNETKTNNTLVVDMGHAQTTVTVLTTTTSASDEVTLPPPQVVLHHDNLGAGCMDVRLWHYFVENVEELKNVTSSSKEGYRLLKACRKLKHVLSQLPEGSVTVENVNDKDVVISASRALLADQCQAEHDALVELLQKAIQGENKMDAIEVLGGACRVPWVKETILKTVGGGIESLSHSLDDTSIALGAAVLSCNDSSMEKLEATDRRVQLRQAEAKMAALDEEERKKDFVHNQLEAHVLEMRAAKHGKHGSLLPMAELDAHLEQVDEWLFGITTDEEAITLEESESKLESILNTTRELCKDYFKAVQQEAKAKEEEMNQEAKLAQAQSEKEEEEDHDNRRLPKKRRMEIVEKNKKEANELFADGNYRHAAARYAKALTHCSKFVDLSPDDTEKVNNVKLSLCLNLALAYIKLQMWDQALRVCNDALEIDPESTKALYRRATVYYEKKQWDNANRDAQQAAETAPNDKAIQKLLTRIDLQFKKQKAKEKKMAQKMFG